MKFHPRGEVALNHSCIVNKLDNLKFLSSGPTDICIIDIKSVVLQMETSGLLIPFICLNSPAYKKVLFLTKLGLTKSYKGLIFISEKVWAPCI